MVIRARRGPSPAHKYGLNALSTSGLTPLPPRLAINRYKAWVLLLNGLYGKTLVVKFRRLVKGLRVADRDDINSTGMIPITT